MGVLNLTIETTRCYKNRENELVTENFQFKVVCFGILAKHLKSSLKEGMSIRIVGRLEQNKWMTDGVTHSEVQIVAEHIEVRGGTNGKAN